MHAVDWLPTLASMVGVKPNEKRQLDGVDQLKAFKEGSKARPRKGNFLGYSMIPRQEENSCREGDKRSQFTGAMHKSILHRLPVVEMETSTAPESDPLRALSSRQ